MELPKEENTTSSQPFITLEDTRAALEAISTVGKTLETKKKSEPNLYSVKEITFFNRSVTIVMQNENGPCPLIAIANVLLLRGTMKNLQFDTISNDDLLHSIADVLVEKNLSSTASTNEASFSEEEKLMRSNLQHNINVAIAETLPILKNGLDINIKFEKTTGFEFISHLSVFDLLSINLYHGWVVDPNDAEFFPVIGKLSYNQVVEKAIPAISTQPLSSEPSSSSSSTVDASQSTSGEIKEQIKSEDRDKIYAESLVASKFLTTTASQLTYYGLIKLHEQVKERELCVFFRNNHFSTMFKLNGELYTLVTDQGYLRNDTIAWEHLTAVDGDTEYVSPAFGNPNAFVESIPDTTDNQQINPRVIKEADSNMDPDMLLALQLQQEEESGQAQRQHTRSPPPPPSEAVQPTRNAPPQQQRQSSDDGCYIL